jgi:hypothetical protein
LVTPVPLSPLLLLCCAYGGGSIKISLQAMPYKNYLIFELLKKKIWAKFQRIMELFTQKVVTKLSKI